MQKHVNLADLVKSLPTNIYLQNLASIQPRTSPLEFDHLAEKSENGSSSNLSTKVKWRDAGRGFRAARRPVLHSPVDQEAATGARRQVPVFCRDEGCIADCMAW